MKKLMLTLAVSLAFAPAAFAADAAAAKASAMPAYGKDKPIPAPTIGKKTLANGKTRTVEVTGTYDAATKTYTQTGTITRFDGSKVTFTRTKSPTGRTAEATDTRNNVKVKAAGAPTGATTATVSAGIASPV